MRFWQILFSCGSTIALLLIVDEVKTLDLGLSQSLARPPVGQGAAASLPGALASALFFSPSLHASCIQWSWRSLSVPRELWGAPYFYLSPKRR